MVYLTLSPSADCHKMALLLQVGTQVSLQECRLRANIKDTEEVTDAITHFILCHFYTEELNIPSTSVIGLQCCSLQIQLLPHGRRVRRQATAPSWSRGRWRSIVLLLKQEIRHFKALSCSRCSIRPETKDIFAKRWHFGRSWAAGEHVTSRRALIRTNTSVSLMYYWCCGDKSLHTITSFRLISHLGT